MLLTIDAKMRVDFTINDRMKRLACMSDVVF